MLALSGCSWLVAHYLLTTQGSFGPKLHALEPVSLRIHGAAAMVALVGLGSLTVTHIKRAWHARRNRVSGVVLLGLFFGLTLTGYLLYYFGGEESRPILSLVHWVAGLLAIAGFATHLILGLRGRRHVDGVGAS